ncbi:MAG: hypothetical protein EOO11_14485 [Chitinophagaceae bacterium]|nr:MAG: hypothetical protein EOO11_14485 [Chitinophagaceae bacterium]
MKNSFFRLTVAGALLAAGALTSCAPVQGTSADEYYERDPYATQSALAPQRIWVEDPYRPGATMLVERDPFTGRYYPVSGSTYGVGSYRSGIYTTPAPYGYPRSRGRGGYRNGDRYGSTPPQRPAPARDDAKRREAEQRRQDARDQLLGKKQ